MTRTEVFKRGQIIPKRLGMQFFSVHKKARHNVTFGADTEVTNYGHKLVMRALTDGPVINVARTPKRKRANGTLQESLLTVSFVQLVGAITGVFLCHKAQSKSKSANFDDYPQPNMNRGAP